MVKGRNLSAYLQHTHIHTQILLFPKGNGCLSQLFCKCDFLIVSKLTAFTFKTYFKKLSVYSSVPYTGSVVPGFYLYWYPGPSSLQGCKKCLFLCLGGPHLPKCRPMWEVISLRTSIYYLHQYSKRPAHTIHLTVLFMAPISGLSYF